jgi:hypothetical protein
MGERDSEHRSRSLAEGAGTATVDDAGAGCTHRMQMSAADHEPGRERSPPSAWDGENGVHIRRHGTSIGPCPDGAAVVQIEGTYVVP